MAHAAVVTIRRRTISRRRTYIVTISETDAGAADDVPIVDTVSDVSPERRLPAVGTVTMVRSTLTGGSGATIDPALGTAAGWTVDTQQAVWANGAPAVHIDVNPLKTYDGGKLHWRAIVDAGADNPVETEIWIVEGFEI